MNADFIPYQPLNYSESEMILKSEDFFNLLDKRRTVREFSDKKVDQKIIDHLIKAASTAPSGAHKQPWTFCVVSSPKIKKQIRKAAEKEEFENYNGRMSAEWLKDLEIFDTNWEKPFLEKAPYLIVVFKQTYSLEDDKKSKNYYVNESVGIATGFLIAAAHQAGLATLTHTPSPLNFLTEVLKRPINEKPFLLIPIGYPADDVKVPRIKRKDLKEIVVYYP